MTVRPGAGAAEAQPAPSASPVLSVRNLRVDFKTRHGVVRAVDGVSFDLAPGTTLGLVGESGSGKSVTALAVLDLLDPKASHVTAERMRLLDYDLLAMDGRARAGLRGRHMTMVMQNPLSSLDPLFTVAGQIRETVPGRVMHQVSTETGLRSWRDYGAALLNRVRIPDAVRRLGQYPHELSGGMRQRVASAIALSPRPTLLIADEPTTALDVTTQVQFLHLLNELQRELGLSIIIISHDFGVVARTCDQVAVMYCGRIVEDGPTSAVLERPQHPYTRALLASIPEVSGPGRPLATIPGQPPNPMSRPSGCAFHPRCAQVFGRCSVETPALEVRAEGHAWACWLDQPPAAPR